MAVGMDLLKQEGHVRGQSTHGLHTLGVEFHLALAGTGETTAAPAAAIVAFLINSLLSI